MREIKFRVWSFDPLLEEPEMLQWEDINRLDSEGLMHLCDVIDGTEKNVDLMQFTGLKDKNGKEIYEGDILGGGHLGFVCPVTFADGCFQLRTNEHQGDSPITQDRVGRLEIIGNIHQHPELLKQ